MELVEGRVLVEMPVGRRHARTAARLARVLGDFVEEHGLGEVHVEIGTRTKRSPDSVRAPDVSYITSTLLEKMPADGFLDGPPTLAIEVMSPEDREAEVARKVEEYFDAGAARVWVVRPLNATVTVHRTGGDSHTYTGTDALTSEEAGFAVEGFRLELAQLFQE